MFYTVVVTIPDSTLERSKLYDNSRTGARELVEDIFEDKFGEGHEFNIIDRDLSGDKT